MSKHLWNIACDKESLWVKWVNAVRLKGNSIWEVKMNVDSSCGWKQILALREKIRPHICKKVGNGEKNFFWHDYWCNMGIIKNLASLVDGSLDEEFSKIKICELIESGQWKWPNDWTCNYPFIQTLPIPILNRTCEDDTKWRDNDGNECSFSISKVWRDLRPNSSIVPWYKLVWFSQCIPKHSFILWLAIHGRLSTQDKLLKWYPDKIMKCFLCGNGIDSHNHLFFECDYSSKVWEALKSMILQKDISNSWESILECMYLLPCRKSIYSVVRRLTVAAGVYFIWQERNKRAFYDDKREWKEVLQQIIHYVRFKLVSLCVKPNKQTDIVSKIWQVQFKEMVAKEDIINEWKNDLYDADG